MYLQRIQSSEVSVGHCYNLIDISTRKILTVETASKNRLAVYEINATPFFHANMYLHLQVPQVKKVELCYYHESTIESNITPHKHQK